MEDIFPKAEQMRERVNARLDKRKLTELRMIFKEIENAVEENFFWVTLPVNSFDFVFYCEEKLSELGYVVSKNEESITIEWGKND